MDKEGHYMLIKGTIEQKDRTIKNMYAPNNTASKYTKEQLEKKKSHKDSEAKNIQINFHCKAKELLQWRITGLNVNIMT